MIDISKGRYWDRLWTLTSIAPRASLQDQAERNFMEPPLPLVPHLVGMTRLRSVEPPTANSLPAMNTSRHPRRGRARDYLHSTYISGQ